MRRRDVLELGVLAAALGISRATQADEALLRHLGTPQNLGTPLEYLNRLTTPTSVFFVRSHFGPPAYSSGRKLHISGLVKHPLELDAISIRRFPEVTLTAVLQCAGNGRALHVPRVPGVQWVHGAMGQASWTGVLLKDLLEKAELAPEVEYLRLQGADAPPKPSVPSFVRGLPRARALDPTTLVAYRMNGEPLSLAHGAPYRLVVPGWAGDHWVKWLTDVRAQKEEPEGFYYDTAYRLPTEPVEPGSAVPPEKMKPLTAIPVKSVIAQPLEGSRRPVGAQEIVGVVFSGTHEIAKVEVSLDGGNSWRDAAIEGEPGAGRWQLFRTSFDAPKPGLQRAVVRATEVGGVVQPEKAAWNPGGYFWNGWHAVSWEVVA